MRASFGVIWLRLSLILLILGSVCFEIRSARAEEEVRIAILSDQRKIDIGGKSLAIYDAESGERIANSALSLTPDNLPARRILVEAKGGVHAGSGVYLGRIEIAKEGDRLIAINRLPLETYLLGIVGSEMSPEWPIEALKAQAVAARTYALQRRMMMRAANKSYDLESSVISQVYKGAERIRPSVIRAVKETRGEVMSYRHGLVEALFHSTCGGKTSSSLAAFGRSIPYLTSEPCRWCRDSAKHTWHIDVPIKELSRLLERGNVARGRVEGFERKEGASLVSVRERRGKEALSPKAVRKAMGYGVLFSENFTAKTSGGVVHIAGAGFGHGVGMCQWGARGLALEGRSHEDILEYYYRGIRVQRIY